MILTPEEIVELVDIKSFFESGLVDDRIISCFETILSSEEGGFLSENVDKKAKDDLLRQLEIAYECLDSFRIKYNGYLRNKLKTWLNGEAYTSEFSLSEFALERISNTVMNTQLSSKRKKYYLYLDYRYLAYCYFCEKKDTLFRNTIEKCAATLVELLKEDNMLEDDHIMDKLVSKIVANPNEIVIPYLCNRHMEIMHFWGINNIENVFASFSDPILLGIYDCVKTREVGMYYTLLAKRAVLFKQDKHTGPDYPIMAIMKYVKEIGM